MLTAGKIMLLILIAIFKNGEMDSDALILGVDKATCEKFAATPANTWKMRDQNIVAIQIICEESDDPRPTLYKLLPELVPKHTPAKDEA